MKLTPRSRRFIKDQSHAYGWWVSFRQTVLNGDGTRSRVYFSGLGVNRNSAIGNALGSRPDLQAK